MGATRMVRGVVGGFLLGFGLWALRRLVFWCAWSVPSWAVRLAWRTGKRVVSR